MRNALFNLMMLFVCLVGWVYFAMHLYQKPAGLEQQHGFTRKMGLLAGVGLLSTLSTMMSLLLPLGSPLVCVAVTAYIAGYATFCTVGIKQYGWPADNLLYVQSPLSLAVRNTLATIAHVALATVYWWPLAVNVWIWPKPEERAGSGYAKAGLLAGLGFTSVSGMFVGLTFSLSALLFASVVAYFAGWVATSHHLITEQR